MSRYILIDTWNGEGYSDSKATIVNTSFPNLFAKNNAQECAGSYDVVRYDEQVEGIPNAFCWTYEIDGDAGMVTIIPVPKNLAGVILKPNINDFELVLSASDWEDCIRMVKDVSEDYEEDKVLFGVIHHNMDECDWMLFPKGEMEDEYATKNVDNYSYHSEGDGVEYEIWKHNVSGTKYRVPIEIVRDFDNKETYHEVG